MSEFKLRAILGNCKLKTGFYGYLVPEGVDELLRYLHREGFSIVEHPVSPQPALKRYNLTFHPDDWNHKAWGSLGCTAEQATSALNDPDRGPGFWNVATVEDWP